MARRWFYFRLASVIVRDGRVVPRSSSFLNLLTATLFRSPSLEKLSGAEITFLAFLCSLQGLYSTLLDNSSKTDNINVRQSFTIRRF